MDKELCLVSASSGLDSTLTLCVLSLSGYKSITACHFCYNHRGENAEKLAIKNICNKLKIPLKIFDLTNLYKEIDNESMLTDPNCEITTGTSKGLKQLDAWCNGRNMMFMSVMASYAESQVMKFNYNKVYLLGGFLSLTESGIFPDNSEAFLNSCLEMFKYGTLIGNRIAPLFCLSNIMKHELFVLIKELHLESIYKHTISCDRPKTVEGVTYNCEKDGIPACGSGLLSYWGSKMVGMNDMELRNFYEVDDPSYEAFIPEHLKQNFTKSPDINDIINRILLPEDKLENLRKLIKK